MYFRNCDLETLPHPDAKQWLDPPSAPSNYKDVEKIAAYIKEAEIKQLEDCALHPHTCKIVAFGWEDIGHSDPTVAICTTEFEEREQLKQFWESWYDLRRRAVLEQRDLPPQDRTEPLFLTYNGHRFDLLVLMIRSMYLKVKFPEINIDRYRSPHIDLYQKLTFRGVVDGGSLRFFAKRLGLPIYDDITGADVARMAAAGEWQKIHDHCLSDLALNRAIAEHFGFIPVIRKEVAA